MNKRQLNVSPSQLKKFETCPRLTAWQLCTRVKPPPGPPDARALGERAHALAEAWLLRGERPDPTETIEIWRKPTKQEAAMFQDEASDQFLLDSFPGALMAVRFGSEWRVQDRAYVGAIALSHLQTLPAPKTPGLEVEVAATVTTPAATYKARADYRHRAFGVSTIGDHKFVGDLSYALTNRPGSVNGFKEPNYLGDDVQAIVQAKAEFEADPALACVSLAWHYTQTKAVRGEYPTRVVRLTLTREQVDLAMQAIDPVAAQISTVFDLQIQPHALPPRLAVNGGCDRIYGRPCEYVSHCNLTLQEKQDQHMNTPSESQQRLAAALEAAKKLTNGSFLTAEPVAPPSAQPAFVVPTFAPPPAFAPPSFTVPIAAPPEASAPPAFVVPTFAPPAFAPTFVGTADTGPMLSGDRFVAAILADMDLEERAALHDPINPPEAPPNVHVQTASVMFGVPVAEVTEEQRIEAKRATFGQSGVPAFVIPDRRPSAEIDPINPPEAPPSDGTFGPVATAKRVEEVEIPGGDLEALDRAAAKKICVQRGLVAASSRLGVEALRDLIRKADAGVPIERVDMAQFVPSVEEVDHISAAPENAPRFVAGVLPSVEEAFETMDGAIRMAQNFVSQEEGEKLRRAIDTLRSQFEYLENERALAIQATDATSVRNALDRLNDVGDFLRAMIGA